MASGTLRKNLIGYAFISPWLIALGLFIGFPFLAGLYFSFCDYPPLKSPEFIGLANYQEMVFDKLFWNAMRVTLTYGAVAIPLGVCLALTIAMFLNARIRGQTFYRVIFYIPFLVPTAVVAILWMWIFNPQYGLLDFLLKTILGYVDQWVGLFFSLPAALKGEQFLLFPTSILIFLAVPATAVAAWFFGQRLKRDRRQGIRGGGNTGLFILSILVMVVSVLTIIYACLHYLMPEDMTKVHAPTWLGDGNPMPSAISFAPVWALWALIVMSMWAVGQMAVIYLAKLQDVPAELYEAAEIDGATWAQKTWHVTIPQITPIILFNVVMAIIGEFQVFVEPYIMTDGGPEDKTRFVAMFVYQQAFSYQRVGYASAVAFVLFLMIVTLTVLAFKLLQKRVYYAGR
jgi:ABC-type sugar transport system permease subunit